jgi:MFS family permease
MASESSQNMDTEKQEQGTPKEMSTTAVWQPSLRFWSVFVALCLLSFISALDVAIVATALPTIIKDVGGERHYVWIANSFVLASSVPQPIFGQISNIFGRRNPTIFAVVMFTLGSGIAGGAHNSAAAIAGRSIQGVGAGGIYVLIDIICSDLVPLRERGKYIGYLFSLAGVGAAIGPVVGGALALRDWRWIFYMNIPISGLALVVVLLFLKVNWTRNDSWKSALSRVDFTGSFLFMCAMVAILFALIAGGVQYAWNSWRIILPLTLGTLTWVIFHVHQASTFCTNPIVPPLLFANRTSAIGLILAFLSNFIIQAMAYFLPVYFQGVLGTSALTAGTNFLPFAIPTMFFAVVGGAVLSKTGFYRPVHLTAFAFMAIGAGIFSLMSVQTTRAQWVGFQVVTSVGTGFVQSTILPAIMAGLPDSETASATSAYGFTRTFGQIWGVTVAGIVFNAAFDRNADRIRDKAVRMELSDGKAYAYASNQFVKHLPDSVRLDVVGVYTSALKAVWWVCVGFAVFAFFCVFAERDLKLRDQLDTDYGLKEEKVREEKGKKVAKPKKSKTRLWEERRSQTSTGQSDTTLGSEVLGPERDLERML